MKDKECIFCKIANGEIPSTTIHEDQDFRVILDLNPASKGHALILPKKHYKDIYELDASISSKVLLVAQSVITKMTKVLGCEGYNILQNNGVSAGQTVFHYHMHLIPRYKGDQVNLSWQSGTLSQELQDEILGKLK